MTQNSSVPAFRRERIEAAKRAAQEANQQQVDLPPQNFDVPPTTPPVDRDKEANDAAAWKGRLTKTQEELRQEREAKNQLSIEALQAAERARQAEERARQAQEALAEAQGKLQTYQQREQENFLSDDEKRQLEETFGSDATTLLTKVLGKVRPQVPQMDVGKVIDERLQEVTTKTLEREWATAVKTRIPEAHILRADEEFIQFASNKTDWFGNNALSVMDEIGATRDVGRIDFIERLISEFKTQKEPVAQDNPANNPTVPPHNVQTPPTRPGGNGKKRVSQREFDDMVRHHKARGETVALRKYLAEHEVAK